MRNQDRVSSILGLGAFTVRIGHLLQRSLPVEHEWVSAKLLHHYLGLPFLQMRQVFTEK